MFTPEQRADLRTALLSFAAADPRITGTAITGSAATSGEDQWSDIDLAVGIRATADLQSVLEDWTAHMYADHQAVHHVDIFFNLWTYRVFLLANTLQVDVAFVTEEEFRPLAPTFRLVSGTAKEPVPSASTNPTQHLIGMAWLYAIHVRTSLARKKLWQAEYMLSALRDNTLALACLRHNLPAVHARGVDLLPNESLKGYEECLPRRLSEDELTRTFRLTLELLQSEVSGAQPELAVPLSKVFALL